jgi:ubiquinone/menaquinone biosynthesis C-methylase UbiE
MKGGVDRREVLRANVVLHTRLASVYRETEPHYRPENLARVAGILGELGSASGGRGTLLDLGCGMGFIIDLAKQHFRRIVGVDVTEAMLRKVDTGGGGCHIGLTMAELENLPFPPDSVDVATAYAVLHHLHSLEPAFREVYRVLRPGGWFYSDCDPNYYFWEAIKSLPEGGAYAPFVRREIDAVRRKDQELSEKFGVPPELLTLAEILKHDGGGFKAEELEAELRSIGFSEAQVHFEWYIGEARVIHSDDSRACSGTVRSLLHEMLPLTRHLFKYLRIMARK